MRRRRAPVAPALDARFPTPRTAESLTAVENRRRRLVAASFLRGTCPSLLPPRTGGMLRTPPSRALRDDMTAAMNRAVAAGDTIRLGAILDDAERIGDALREFEDADLRHLFRARTLALAAGTATSLLWLVAALVVAVNVADVAGAALAAAWLPLGIAATRAARRLERPGDP